MVCEGKKVVGPIFITKMTGRKCPSPCCCPSDTIVPGFFPCDCSPRTTEIRNFQCITIDLNSPLERIPLPESADKQAIIIKVIGNHNTINITWTVQQEPTNIVKQSLVACTPETTNSKGGIIGGDTTGTENQVKWWQNVFQSNSITDRYNLYMGDCTTNPIPNPTPTTFAQECANFAFSRAYHHRGAIQNVRFQKNGTTPVTYTGSLTFFIGNVQATPNECG